MAMLSAEFHRDFIPFKISTSEIGVSDYSASRTLSVAAIDAMLREPTLPEFSWHATKDAMVHFTIERENDHSFIVHVKTWVSLSSLCVRCLNPVEYELSLDFSERMLEKEHLGIDAEDLSFDSEESGDEEDLVGYFANQCIDVGVILRDQVFFCVPDYPHCPQENESSARCGEVSHLDKDNENPFVKFFNKTK